MNEDSRYPTTRPTRDEFIGPDKGQYTFALRLTQTASVGYQVAIEELAAFAEEARWIVAEEHDLPINFHDVDGNGVTLNCRDVRRNRIDEETLEAEIECLADRFDVALAKNISMSRNASRSPPNLFVKYTYGWGGTDEKYATDPLCPHARTEWVGGDRGQPQTMRPSRIRVKAVE